MKKLVKNVLSAGVVSVLLSGCASHDFVKREIANLEQRRNAVDEAQNARIAELDATARQALDRANAAHKLAEGKFMFSTVLSDDSVKFASGRAVLSAEARGRLMQLADQLKADNKNVYLEVQGHTDSVGPDAKNEMVGQRRADAVRLFLNQQGIALNRMATVSYGETTPAASNSTAEGRAANRRVVIVVMN
ncbi:OmpA family protein [Sphingorhabdus sp.]|uniref:OmpA family protein n=1 Tax=Sphingorhabdus sp. TaxID=1902408 RepID=UPI0037C9FA6A